VKNNLGNPITTQRKTVRVILINILVLIIIIGISFSSKYRNHLDQMGEDAMHIASQLDNFFQIGELYISNYAHPDLINLPVEQQYEQFQKDLLPFPFFNQLSLYSSSGQLITGFPNEKETRFTKEFISSLNNISIQDPTFFLRTSGNALSDRQIFIFIKVIANPENNNKVYLVGETDWSSNPINLNLLDLIQELNLSNNSIKILGDTDFEAINLESSTSIVQSATQHYIKKTYPLSLNNWTIEISQPLIIYWKDSILNILPTFLILIIIGSLISYAYLSERIELDFFTPQNGKSNSGMTIPNLSLHKKNLDLKQESRNLGDTIDFIQDISHLTNKNEIGQVIIKYISRIQNSSIRLVLFDNPYLPSQGFFSLYLGNRSRNYAYLDDQIIKQTQDGKKLFIPDIRKVQLILLNQEKPYPLSIFVYPIIEDELLYGVLWLGFEQTYQITSEENDFISEILEKVSPHLLLAINSDVLNSIISEQDSILECLKLPIIILDEQNKIIYINKFIIELENEFENKLGFKLEELNLDHAIKKLISEEAIENTSSSNFYSKNDRNFQVLGFRKEIAKNRLIDIFVFHEITAEKQLKDNLTNNLALLTHSMRTPLASMKGYTNMLAMIGQVNDQQKDYIQKILTSVDEMSNFVKNLLDIDKLEKGANLHLENVDCLVIINKVVESLKTYSVQKQIEIKKEFKGFQELNIFADPFLIERALFNLIENAIRYTDRRGLVTIETEKKDQVVVIIVKDNGIGIAQIDIPHIFEKYYRVKINSSLDRMGSGLGLYLVKSIIDQHKGKISISSVLGKGSEFIIELPYR